MALFELYKPSQGKYVRWGTVVFAGTILLIGMSWLGNLVHQTFHNPITTATAVCLFGAIGAAIIFYAVNHARTAEFMIMTESEMRKVNWPSRRVVINSTKVVIVLTLIMAVILYVVDIGFIKGFEWLGVG